MKIPSPRLFVVVPAITAAGLLAFGQDGETWGDSPAPDFLRDVRPILTQKCFGCHGPDEAKREADLRLDIPLAQNPGLTEDLGGYALLVPGDPESSELIARLLDEDDPMPPVDALAQLTDAEKHTLASWVASGAEWAEHWAFVAPERPELPPVTDGDWARNPLDHFVLARIEAQGLTPSPEAEREAWLRRVSFDLIGLPPTLEELDAFLADTEDGAFDRVVDRLFASEHYGERQAQDWLDVARYADSNGNQFDISRNNWKWRDWVIEAFNENKPFDDFTVEQLAGDLLPNPTLDQLVATGFNRNHQTDNDSPSEPDEYRTEYVTDRVHTTATAFLGMTMACAQCHDHKFDPVSQADYFSFFGFFNNVAERDIDFGNPRPLMRVPNPDQAPLLADLDARILELEQWLDAEDPIQDRSQAKWEVAMRAELAEGPEWSTLEPTGMLSHNGARLRWQDDGSILAAGPTPARDVYDLVFQPGKRQVQAIRLEVLPDPSQPGGASGRAADGTFKLTKLILRDGSLSDGTEPPQVYMALAQSDVDQRVKDETVEYENLTSPGAIDGAIVYESGDDEQEGFGGFSRGGGGWTLVGRATAERHEVLLIPLEPLDLNDASILKVTMEQKASGRAKSLIGRFRWSVTDDVRVREQLLPLAPKQWRTLGPFPAEDVAMAFAKELEPERDLAEGLDLKKRYELPIEESEPEPGKGGEKGQAGGKAAGKAEPKAAKQAPVMPPPAEAVIAVAVQGVPAGLPKKADPDRNPAQPGADAVVARDTTKAKPEAAAGGKPATEPEPAPASRPKREPAKLAWEQQKTWKDGGSSSLEVGTGVYYLTREVHARRAGIAELRLDGPAGVKVWLNGELVFEDAPPLAPPKAPEPTESEGPGGFDFGAFLRQSMSGPGRVARLGFREGTNELVVKAVFQKSERRGRRSFGGGGSQQPTGSVTFDFTAEGADVLSYEVLTALRATAAAPTPDAIQPATGQAAALRKPASRAGKPGTGTGTSDDDQAATTPPDTDALFAPTAGAMGAREHLGVQTIQPAPQRYELEPDARHAEVLREHYRRKVSTIGRALATELERLEMERRELVADIPETLVMAERAERRDNYIFLSGDYRQRGADVTVGTPASLPAMDPSLPKNRLGLARWLTSGSNPLLGRVTMNRMWQSFFGLGIVDTPEDFGVRSELPEHGQLLDWLAVEFVDSGWDWQHMQRLVVLSATYRQTASASPEAYAADPKNRDLARGPRQRLSAEAIRDNALHVSGLLHPEVGGPSVKPYQSPGVWSEVFGGSSWRQSKGEDQYRRGLYTYWKRRAPYPAMATFDAQKGEVCTVKRPLTNTPLQALVLLNNPVYVEAARVLAQRTLAEDVEAGPAQPVAATAPAEPTPSVAEVPGEAASTTPPASPVAPTVSATDTARLTAAFRRCTSRPPTAAELELLGGLLAEQRAHYAADPEAAGKLLEIGDAPGLGEDSDLTKPELAAWTAVMSALLNLDATIHRG
ncbi:MAG: DUF1553 domain-containing protein [Planctomycetota bacterium]|nr:DUF1553 domain-containing protein [Planctomycetota bacterium]